MNEAYLTMIDAELIARIAGRRVIVDACVLRDQGNSSKHCGLVVRHVVDIDAKLTDQDIAALMFPDEVLMTRDYGFYRILGKEKSILLPSKHDTPGEAAVSKLVVKCNQGPHKRGKPPSHIRIALRQNRVEEAKTGILYMKIQWCIWWLVLLVT